MAASITNPYSLLVFGLISSAEAENCILFAWFSELAVESRFFRSDLVSLLQIGISAGLIRHCGDFWRKRRGKNYFQCKDLEFVCLLLLHLAVIGRSEIFLWDRGLGDLRFEVI